MSNKVKTILRDQGLRVTVRESGPATDHDDDAHPQARGGDPAPPVGLLPRGAERGEWREEHMLCVCWVRTQQGVGGGRG